MYEIQQNGPYYTLLDYDAEVTATVASHRGALLTNLTIRDHEVVYFSEENFVSNERPRCGMPILFPVCGRSTDEKVALKGQSYPMPIHGFAHTSPWQIADAHAGDDGTFLTLTLTDTPGTREFFPYAFHLQVTFRLSGGTLTVYHLCSNRDDTPLPFDFGYHPYFRISALSNAAITIPGKEPLLLPNGPETGCLFPGHHSPVRMFDSGLGHGVELSCDKQFNLLLLWGIPEKKFVCIEPWRANMDGLNTGTTITLAPGGQNEGTISLRPILED